MQAFGKKHNEYFTNLQEKQKMEKLFIILRLLYDGFLCTTGMERKKNSLQYNEFLFSMIKLVMK